MYVVQIASELAPIAKVGGLADVVFGLSKQLVRDGHLVEVIIPKYDCMDHAGIEELAVFRADLKSFYRGKWVSNTVWRGKVDGLVVYFIEPHNDHPFFSRGEFYHCADNVDRFTYFSRVALEFLHLHKKHPDVLHCHDWHTGLVPVLYNEIYRPLGMKVKGIVFTIHNMEHQGFCDPFILDFLGLNGAAFLHPDKMQDPWQPKLLNLLKAGVVFSTYFTTVSPTYAKEVQTLEGGFGLHDLMRQFSYKFDGILNGIDYEYWNAEKDRYLPTRYTVETLEKKEEVKAFLKKRLHFQASDKPIVGCIARLVPQKGVKLIEHALFRTLEQGGQMIILGTSPDPVISKHFHELKMRLAPTHNVHFELQYNEELSHQIYSGCDFFIVPSIFEPCGLTQMISLRYGTVPIVRHTGGLADTVFDVEYSNKPQEERNGYCFNHADAEGVNSALDRALHDYYHHKEKIKALREHAMKMDLSWKQSAKRYTALYRRCL